MAQLEDILWYRSTGRLSDNLVRLLPLSVSLGCVLWPSLAAVSTSWFERYGNYAVQEPEPEHVVVLLPM